MKPNEPQQQKILILTGDLGDGHKQAARALVEAAGLYKPDVPVEVVDFMEWTHPRLHNFNKYCYLQWVKTFPSLYGYLFQKTRNDNSFSHLIKKVRLFGLGRMLKLLMEVRPTVVVSTFPSAAAAMSILKMNGLTDVPTVTVITDHTDHSYWIHPGTDRYIVGSEHVRRALHRFHVSGDRVTVTGIPVRPQFFQTYDRNTLRIRHDLDTAMPTVMVMGGGYGMIGKEFVNLLLSDALPERMQFIIVCGHNTKLRLQLEEDLRGCKHMIRLTGYVDYVHELMAVSDLLITKPGGLTTAEALSLELPMLLYKPLPGQEQDNVDYLLHAGVALLAESETDLADLLVHVFQNRQILHKIKTRARQNQRKTAALRAVNEILLTTSIPEQGCDIPRAAFAEA